jgi:hypothetical protein
MEEDLGKVAEEDQWRFTLEPSFMLNVGRCSIFI